MKKLLHPKHVLFFTLFLLILLSCHRKNKVPSNEAINAINLKRGEVVLCGPPDKQFGTVEFETSCSEKEDFNLGIALLHSFEYEGFCKNY
jgi:hypothetical protein